jgi:superfamily I DNA/RNA helicase
MFVARRKREESSEPVKILVLTFNRTLAGYIEALAREQFDAGTNVELTVDTFAHWAVDHFPGIQINDAMAKGRLQQLAANVPPLTANYVMKEAEYLLGRFEPDKLANYITQERTGRGVRPRVEQTTRRKVLDEVVAPYLDWLNEKNLVDWNGLALMMKAAKRSLDYDVVVVDESQDFSANQLRAIKRHLAQNHAITFVIDTVQRVYARGFTWAESGFTIAPGRSHTLLANYRNTVEIAAFAAGILRGIAVDSDGALPNLNHAKRHGQMPIVLRGKFGAQMQWAVDYINKNVDLSKESVAFLAPLGGRWFDEVRLSLERNDLAYVELTRESHWPAGNENIALCTFHSAKGLEFDHVFILGLADKNTSHGDQDADDEIVVLRRLFAIAVARARNFVAVGYKAGEESKLIGFLEDGTYRCEDV